jgi:hypothetical protein
MSSNGKTPFGLQPSVHRTVRGILRILALGLLATASHAARHSRACSDALLATTSPATRGSHACSDPCLVAARAERTDCRSSAQGVFLDAVSVCPRQDVGCVDACATDRQDCRDATTLGQDLAVCEVQRDAAKARCRIDHALEPRRLVVCLKGAEIGGFRCKREARRAHRDELRACRSAFRSCAGACGPGGPAGGAQACRADGKAALLDAFDECRLAYRVTASACIDRDLACLQVCGDELETCNAPTRAAVDAAIDVCVAARKDAVAACAAANPDGGPALESCIQSAAATAFTCREAAIKTSLPGFAACTGTFASCARACPPASS